MYKTELSLEEYKKHARVIPILPRRDKNIAGEDNANIRRIQGLMQDCGNRIANKNQ
jgi:hypothetical protein